MGARARAPRRQVGGPAELSDRAGASLLAVGCCLAINSPALTPATRDSAFPARGDSDA